MLTFSGSQADPQEGPQGDLQGYPPSSPQTGNAEKNAVAILILIATLKKYNLVNEIFNNRLVKCSSTFSFFFSSGCSRRMPERSQTRMQECKLFF